MGLKIATVLYANVMIIKYFPHKEIKGV